MILSFGPSISPSMNLDRERYSPGRSRLRSSSSFSINLLLANRLGGRAPLWPPSSLATPLDSSQLPAAAAKQWDRPTMGLIMSNHGHDSEQPVDYVSASEGSIEGQLEG